MIPKDLQIPKTLQIPKESSKDIDQRSESSQDIDTNPKDSIRSESIRSESIRSEYIHKVNDMRSDPIECIKQYLAVMQKIKDANTQHDIALDPCDSISEYTGEPYFTYADLQSNSEFHRNQHRFAIQA